MCVCVYVYVYVYMCVCVGASNAACHSFVLKTNNCSRPPFSYEWQTYPWGTGSAVRNTDWMAYTRPGNSPAPPHPHPPPAPPPPSRPQGADPELDCMIRRLALQRASQLLPGRGAEAAVFDALELGVLCNDTRPASPVKALGSHHIANPHPNPNTHPNPDPNPNRENEFVVDPDPGRCKPHATSFCTVHAALAAARAANIAYPRGTSDDECIKKIILKNGTHFLNATLVLGPGDSQTCILGAAGASPVLSGGTQYTVNWTADTQHGVLVAQLPAGTPALDQLFVGGRREILAKHPNGDPETTGRFSGHGTDGTGYAGNEKWGSASGGGHGGGSKTTATRSHPHCPKYSTTFNVARYAGTPSHWGATPRPQTLQYNPKSDNLTKWAEPHRGVVHTFHGSGWGGWMFKVMGQDVANSTLILDPLGGQQEARGHGSGKDWYVEGVRELLDSAREVG